MTTAAPLRRDLEALGTGRFDLIVVGGGIFGAAAARDAALRGLEVALIEQDDFGAHASANSFKMVHGGIRYLQHLDLARVRESCRERSTLLRIAPHLVQPLPIAIPTYGHGRGGRVFLRAGGLAYDLLTLDRNRAIADPDRRIPKTRFLSRAETLEAFPGLERRDLTGALVFSDAQLVDPARLVLAFVRAAAAAGAVVANRVEATGLLRAGDGAVEGVMVRARDTGAMFEIRGRQVLNATGGFAAALARAWLGQSSSRPIAYTRDVCFVVRRPWPGSLGLALRGHDRDPEAVVARGARHLFVVPWRDVSLIGVWHRVWDAGAATVTVDESEILTCLAEINAVCPGLALTRGDVLVTHAGLLPCTVRPGTAGGLGFGRRSILIDHGRSVGPAGFITLIGVRYTMGRGDAARAVDLVARKLGRALPGRASAQRPVFGGDLEDGFEALVTAAARDRRCQGLAAPVVRALVHDHGSTWPEVLAHAEERPELAGPLAGTSVLAAAVVHAVRAEMASTLADVAFRRTGLATAGAPPPGALHRAAELMAYELGWERERALAEVAQVQACFATPQRRAA